MLEGWFLVIWPAFLFTVQIAIALAASGHAILRKREVKGVIGWVGVIWLTPFVGTLLYVMFGINRIERKAQSLRKKGKLKPDSVGRFFRQAEAARLGEHVPDYIARLAEIGNRLQAHSMTAGNTITPLINGDEAYPAMLQAIREAQTSIAMCSYIFDNDRVGQQFVDALVEAKNRGVEVRVLIDAVGSRYSWTPSERLLRKRQVTTALFLPTLGLTYFVYSNLRNHRKILVIDGKLGFTGGINIRAGNVLAQPSSHPIQDLHFRIEGPVVHHLQSSIASDWEFATGETLEGKSWFPRLRSTGHSIARGIADGPDADFDKLRLTYIGAIGSAQHSVSIVTPYFLPDETLVNALNVAALRGVDVNIIIPEKNNLRMVGWASTSMLWQVLERGCKVWLNPPPFDHSKLIVIDGVWSSIGSANWDPRSLRLNFEFNLECYDAALALHLEQIMERKKAKSRAFTLTDSDGRTLSSQLRDGAARLFSPYL
jgi:cardiolipin synthase A/B